MYSKRKPWRSEKYLAFVREHNCENCGKPAHIDGIEAHHATGIGLGKGVGTKVSDCFVLPVCRVCHQQIHADKDIIDQQRAALLMIEKALQDGVLVVAK